MKRCDVCLHHCLSELPIREFETIKHYTNFIRTRTRCTVLPMMTLFTQARFDCSRSVFPQFVRKIGTNIKLFNVPTFQCSILFNNMGSFNWKSQCHRFDQITWTEPITKGEKFNVTDLSYLREFWDSDSRGWQFTNWRKAVIWGLWFGEMPLKQEAMIFRSTQELIPQGMFVSLVGIKWTGRQSYTCSDRWSKNLVKKKKGRGSNHRSPASEQLIRFKPTLSFLH